MPNGVHDVPSGVQDGPNGVQGVSSGAQDVPIPKGQRAFLDSSQARGKHLERSYGINGVSNGLLVSIL